MFITSFYNKSLKFKEKRKKKNEKKILLWYKKMTNYK